MFYKIVDVDETSVRLHVFFDDNVFYKYFGDTGDRSYKKNSIGVFKYGLNKLFETKFFSRKFSSAYRIFGRGIFEFPKIENTSLSVDDMMTETPNNKFFKSFTDTLAKFTEETFQNISDSVSHSDALKYCKENDSSNLLEGAMKNGRLIIYLKMYNDDTEHPYDDLNQFVYDEDILDYNEERREAMKEFNDIQFQLKFHRNENCKFKFLGYFYSLF